MSKALIFQKSFLISGIMCFDGCGDHIQGFLKTCISECIEQHILPSDAHLIVDAEPRDLGIHQLTLSITTEKSDFILIQDFHSILTAKIKKDILFDVLDEPQAQENTLNQQKNGMNILINLLSMGLVLTLTVIFPPSIGLTTCLTALTFFSTAFTSRDYLFAFYQNFYTKNFANMGTTISLGWFLSMAHTLFHAINMPLASNFSMIFMNFIMPTILIACINGMDEIKRLIVEKSKKNQLKGLKTLFPHLSEIYRSYPLPESELALLSNMVTLALNSAHSSEICSPIRTEDEAHLHTVLNSQEKIDEKRTLLVKGSVIDVNAGECFPVDCMLIQGETVIDASLLTGEPYQTKKPWQSIPIPAGALNLGQKVTVYAVENAYNSTVNKLLFLSNRAKESSKIKEDVPKFAYYYSGLIFIGLLGAILTPIALGIATIPLLMQNIIGILFSVCPCTIAIAHQLPQLISLHHRSSKGIQLRDNDLIAPHSDEIHTVVFDKTGTLTTGHTMVESPDILVRSPIWQRVYLLEKAYGRGHPLAKAIQSHYETKIKQRLLFDDIHNCTFDLKNRGLSAQVQGVKMHIGNFNYLSDQGISLPEPDKSKLEQGFSAVCIAEDGVYKGVIYIQHEIRKGVPEDLARLKKAGIKIIMLTGDQLLAAQGLNKRLHSVFEEEDIHAGQEPQDKETFLSNLLNTKGINPKGVWFVGDGLNDAPCCRVVSEKGGISCAMDSTDKSAFFTDITLNGSLAYLFKHHHLNRSLEQNTTQNKGILIYSTFAFLAFVISFSIAGIATSPLIPMAVMLGTTLLVIFNSYRAQLNVDTALDKVCSWYKKLLDSNLSIGLLLTASTLLITSALVATMATGEFTLPIAAFTMGVAITLSSVCTLAAIFSLSLFSVILTQSLLSEQTSDNQDQAPSNRFSTSAEEDTPRLSNSSLEKKPSAFFLRKRFEINDTIPKTNIEEQRTSKSDKNTVHEL